MRSDGTSLACAKPSSRSERANRAPAFVSTTTAGSATHYFRAACRAALSKPDFRVIDAAYRKAFDSAFRWLQARPGVNEDEAGAFLASQV